VGYATAYWVLCLSLAVDAVRGCTGWGCVDRGAGFWTTHDVGAERAVESLAWPSASPYPSAATAAAWWCLERLHIGLPL